MSDNHALAFSGPSGELICNCGFIAGSPEVLNEHHLVSWNDPDGRHVRARRQSGYAAGWRSVEPDTEAEPVKCKRVACHNRGNGRSCYSLETSRGQVHELTLSEAGRLSMSGGLVMETLLYKLC